MRSILRPLSTLSLLVLMAACGGNTEPSGSEADSSMAAMSSAADTSMSAGMTDAGAKLDLNTAARDDFKSIPNVGDRMSGEFVEYRPYTSILQFRREIGKYVDEDQVAAYEKYVFVPVDPNASDEATLQQLPGVDASAASDLVAGRPYASNDAFLDALGKVVSPEQLQSSERLLVTE